MGLRAGRYGVVILLAMLTLGLTGCGGESKESVSETPQEAATQQKHEAAEKRCEAKGEAVAQGDGSTECVSQEEKQHEIEHGEESGSHYEAEQQANENEEQKLKNEEAEKIEQERSG
jgi:hypothetical protein